MSGTALGTPCFFQTSPTAMDMVADWIAAVSTKGLSASISRAPLHSHLTTINGIMKIEKIFKQNANSEAMLPTKAVSRLPLNPEALSEWTESTDLSQFLHDLYEGTGYGDVVSYRLEEGKEKFSAYAEIFHQAALEARPAPASVSKNIHIPNFAKDSHFGSVAKHMIAWENVIGNILSENGQFSISHILETETDLSSSIHLAAHLYYRQAFQVLRGFIESFVLPVHFCTNIDDLRKWKANSFHIPALRGKSGLLAKMVTSGTLPAALADSVSSVYGVLNGYIHGAEDAFNNGGIHSGNWSGFVYQQTKFERWTDIFSEVVRLGINVLKINLDMWDVARATLGVLCNVCHSQNLEQNSEIIAETNVIKYSCRECNSSFHCSTEGDYLTVTSIEIDE
ncbi:hypothetical protein [Paraburkholderia lycopersici]|uniref:Uncharacterized protein n=1 Tax=Paraburkholderia lycopersici TaxID=416944 RepID=A0A1G6UGM6_9BURK|nr:hypothetical protein [Paraburkholderia lycopersici]SDD40399.1 hypothetical protein SAMN05421548_1191 [Paraburkholderia lycopersici]